MRARMAAVAAGVLVMAGCAPETGEVIGRDYTGEYSYWSEVCTTSTPSKGRTVRTCTPVEHEVEESYTLRLDDGEDVGWREVSEHDHALCHVGDQYPDCAAGGGR